MIPLDELIDKEGNVYEMTCVAIKEAAIYSATDKKKEIEDEGEKIVSVVLTRALNDEIEYTEEDGKEEEGRCAHRSYSCWKDSHDRGSVLAFC